MNHNTVDVYELARTGQSIDGCLAIAGLQRLESLLASDDGEIRFEFQGWVDARGRPAARLRLHGATRLRCNHCDQPLSFEVDAARRFYFVRDENELNAQALDDDEEEALIGDARFDLSALVEDELILSLPMSPRHAYCQAEIERIADAGRDADPAEHPFAALADLRAGKH